MSDDEVDYELLELLKQRLGISNEPTDTISSETGVLKDAEYIYNNAVDVSIDMWSTKSAALRIWKTIQERGYSMQAWSEHELHPKLGEELNEIEMVNFVFTMDLLNFSFWSELSEHDRFQVDYKGKRWTGYMSLVACLQRALSEDTPITTPRFWRSPHCTDEVIRHVFRSATAEQMPLLDERIEVLREAGHVLQEFDDESQDADSGAMSKDARSVAKPADAEETSTTATIHHDTDEEPSSHTAAEQHLDLSRFASTTDESVARLVSKADGSAGKLVSLLVKHFSSFRDECRYEGRKVRLLKRAQIFVADLHAACDGKGLGAFSDIGSLTMFADYRVPQMLHRLRVLSYCPALETQILRQHPLAHRGSWEVQIRGCSIWATELLRREICRQPGAESVNAVLIDFLLYDLAKELESSQDATPHHRTRSINY